MTERHWQGTSGERLVDFVFFGVDVLWMLVLPVRHVSFTRIKATFHVRLPSTF